jgi:hypothetical protein
MSSADLYQQLAAAYHGEGKFPERDRFLVLAMDAAHATGQDDLSEEIRHRLLEHNPNHLIKPYGSSAEALQSPNFANYLGQLRKNFPPAKAQALLNDLGKTMPRPRGTMLAPEARFPDAEPVHEPPPARPPVDVEVRHRAPPSAPVFTYTKDPPVARPPLPPVQDPLAHIPAPQGRQKIMDTTFRLAPQEPPAPLGGGPRPARAATEMYSASGAMIGNTLFLLLFALSLAVLGYFFVWPLLK